MNMNANTRKPAAVKFKYRLIKERIPQGTDSVHYIVPVEIGGRLTQEIPVAELEANPAKYASMFPQYFERVKPTGAGTGSSVIIRSTSKDYKVENGKVVKKTPRRTVADIAAGAGHYAEPKSKTPPVAVAAQTLLPADAETSGIDAGTKRRK